MRICMLTRTLPAHALGGMELHIETLCRALTRAGHTVTLITTSHPDGRRSEEREGVTVHYLPGTAPGKYSAAWWKHSVAAVRDLHAERPFDVIHSQSAGGFGLLIGGVHRQLGIPLVTSLHGTSIDEIKTRLRLGFNIRAKLGLLKNMWSYLGKDRRCLPLSDALIATSDSQVEVIARWYPVDRTRIHLVYNGIDTEAFTPAPADPAARALLASGPQAPVIFSVARLKKEKGVQNVIAALPTVLERHPSAVFAVGGEGEYRSALTAAARSAGVADRVRFLGRVEYARLPVLLNAATVFVNSTVRENGYDLTIPQAMACGKPVVVSDIRSVVSSVVQHEVDGLVYPRSDLAALAKNIIRLLDDPAAVLTIGGRAREKAVARFGLDTMAAKTVAVYESVISAR